MGTLAIRQGDVLYFARSLVWRITMAELAYTTEQLLALSEATRYEMFLTAWERHLKAGLDPSQQEADRVAAIYHTKAVVAKPPAYVGAQVRATVYGSDKKDN